MRRGGVVIMNYMYMYVETQFNCRWMTKHRSLHVVAQTIETDMHGQNYMYIVRGAA